MSVVNMAEVKKPYVNPTQSFIEVVNINVKDIDDNHENNCRGRIIPSDVEDLMNDVRANGLMQAIVIKKNTEVSVNSPKAYRVVAGFRRMMVAKLLRWETIPACIKDVSDEEAAFMNIAENLVRKNLDWVQEAYAIEKLTEKYPNITEVKLAERLGQSRGWIQIRKYILELPTEVQEVIRRGEVTQEQIRIIWQMPDPVEKLLAIKKIKEARERGIKLKLLEPAKAKHIEYRHSRSRGEMFAMQHHIQSSIGNNFGTRLLAWAAGEIDDIEIFCDIKNIAVNQFEESDPRSKYVIPEGPLPKPEL